MEKTARKIGTLTESLEDYLEIIFLLIQEKKVARVRDIAERKGVTMPSVTGALRRLAEEELIKYSAHELVEFTDEGHDLARRVLERHEFIKRFLTEILGVEPSIAENDACAVEHTLSAETLERMATFYSYLTSCSKEQTDVIKQFKECCLNSEQSFAHKDFHCTQIEGDSSDSHQADFGCGHGRRRRYGFGFRNFVTLDQLGSGKHALIIRMGTRGDLRTRLIEMGLLPGEKIEVVKSAPLGDPLEIRVRDYCLSLRKEEAAMIVVKPL